MTTPPMDGLRSCEFCKQPSVKPRQYLNYRGSQSAVMGCAHCPKERRLTDTGSVEVGFFALLALAFGAGPSVLVLSRCEWSFTEFAAVLLRRDWNHDAGFALGGLLLGALLFALMVLPTLRERRWMLRNPVARFSSRPPRRR